GFGTGALVAGYPVYLVKAAIWDGPLNIRCSLTEHCEGVQADPGVDYRAKKRDVLQNLPYMVYRLNMRQGFAMSTPTLRSGAHGTHDAIVDSAIWRIKPGEDQTLEPGAVWAKVYQMEDLGFVP